MEQRPILVLMTDGSLIGFDSEDDLKPLFAEKNRQYAVWLSTGEEKDRKKHALARTAAR